MKSKTLLLVLIPAIALIAGCEKPKTATPTIAKVQAKTTEVANELKDYTYAQKAEFTAAMKTQIAEIDRDLDALDKKLASSTAAVKAEAKPKIEALRLQSAALTKQLDAVKDSTESTWDSVKAGTKKAFGALKDGFNSARDWVGEKIAT
jgi:chromosome segregation ATPase